MQRHPIAATWGRGARFRVFLEQVRRLGLEQHQAQGSKGALDIDESQFGGD
jgi:hypothetical protein